MNYPIAESASVRRSAGVKDSTTEHRSMSGKISSFKPSAPQNATPPKPVIVPWQKKK